MHTGPIPHLFILLLPQKLVVFLAVVTKKLVFGVYEINSVIHMEE